MFDVGWSEILLIATLAIIFIGPKDLPKALRTLGQWIHKARRMASEFQSGLDEMVREAELDEVRRQVEQASRFDLKDSVERTIDPDGGMKRALTIDPDEKSSDKAAADKVAAAEPEPPPPAAEAEPEPVPVPERQRQDS